MSGTKSVQFLQTLVIDTEALLPSPCVRQRSSRMGGPSGVEIRRVRGVCELPLCRGRGVFVLLIREVGPTD